MQSLWRQRGDEILQRVADNYPELIFSGMIKLAKVTRIEVGSPGDFAKLGKRAIHEKLQGIRMIRTKLVVMLKHHTAT